MANIRGRYAIVGIGETEVGRRSEKSGTALGLEAAAATIRDSGLDKSQIDGVITHQARNNPQPNCSAFDPFNYLHAHMKPSRPCCLTEGSLGLTCRSRRHIFIFKE